MVSKVDNRWGRLLLGLCAWAGLAWVGGAVQAADAESVKEDVKKVDDLTVTPLKLEAKGLLPCILWADDKGSAFIVGDSSGVIRRISVPDFTVVKQKDLGRKLAWLSPSKDGLVATCMDTGEVLLLDNDGYAVKKKFEVTQLKRAVSARSLSFIFATNIKGTDLFLLDPKDRTVSKVPTPGYDRGGFLDPVMSPDGRYLFCGTGGGDLTRLRQDNGRVAYEERIRTHAGTGLAICVSPDSKFVCQPAGAGNPDAGTSYGTILFPIDSFTKKAGVLDTGAHPKPVGWDPVAELIYAGNGSKTLMVFSLTGVKKKEYKIGKDTMQRQYLAHPDGNKLLLLTGDKLYFVELPK